MKNKGYAKFGGRGGGVGGKQGVLWEMCKWRIYDILLTLFSTLFSTYPKRLPNLVMLTGYEELKFVN